MCYTDPLLLLNFHRVETDDNLDGLFSGGLVTYCNGDCPVSAATALSARQLHPGILQGPIAVTRR